MRRFADSEIGAVKKNRAGRTTVALIYPNRYAVGMSNLGFQSVYRLLNRIDHVACERSFLPESGGKTQGPVVTVESGTPVSRFDIVAFSVSFENDYPNILTILKQAGLPLESSQRKAPNPLLIAGGVACFINPEPISRFIDCFLIGEAERLVPAFFNTDLSGLQKKDRLSALQALARSIPGIYVPQFYRVSYNTDGTVGTFEPLCDVPLKIERVYQKDLSDTPACSAVLTPDTSFDRTFLVEVAKGCPHGCRFCASGFISRPPRFSPLRSLEACVEKGISLTDRIGLVGAAVSDLPGLAELCGRIDPEKIRISFSSLRADALSPKLISVLAKSRVKTATIAPDAGSERMRRVINKGITEEDILEAAESLVAGGIPNLKLYFMVGLPTETPEDIEAIVGLCKKIKHRFLKSSRTRKRIGEITVSLNSFVPKPFTPFQWAAMDGIGSLKQKIRAIKEGLKRVANVTVHADVPRWAYIQALLSRGDRHVGQILSMAHANQGNWPKTLKASPVNSDFFVYRQREADERFPWDFIDHGIKKSFLRHEYERALAGKTSPDCPLEGCDWCGVCREE